jgi:predicted acetyltransferase
LRARKKNENRSRGLSLFIKCIHLSRWSKINVADLKENVRSIATAQKTGITEMMEEEKKRGPEDLIMRTCKVRI